MHPTAPFVIATAAGCAFYRSLADVAGAWAEEAQAFDAQGRRLSMACGRLIVTSVEPRELARILRRHLRQVDEHRGCTDSWPLWLLVHAAIDYAGYS